jgi:hypothetical protein
MKEGLRAASDPTIEILLLFTGVGRLMKRAAVLVYHSNHVRYPFCLRHWACNSPSVS